jgi:hypothetical protein
MTRVLLVILIISAALVCHAQTPMIAGYFDKDWKPIYDPENATYYRTSEKKEGKIIVKDFLNRLICCKWKPSAAAQRQS